MPRRPAFVMRKIPLFLIAAAVSQQVKNAGEELVRIVVKKVKEHYYDISVRTRSVERRILPDIPVVGTPDWSGVAG
jgi:hypothetical protein